MCIRDRDMNDCTVAKLDGSEGDWMMYEPFYWKIGRASCRERV